MYYKGYKIEAQYLPGDDFRILSDGRVVDKNPKAVDFYCVTETFTGWRHANCKSIKEAKSMINETIRLLANLD